MVTANGDIVRAKYYGRAHSVRDRNAVGVKLA